MLLMLDRLHVALGHPLLETASLQPQVHIRAQDSHCALAKLALGSVLAKCIVNFAQKAGLSGFKVVAGPLLITVHLPEHECLLTVKVKALAAE
jgi:hypothetical protein